MNYNETLARIFEALDVTTVFSNLNPKDNGKTYRITCPKCGEPDGYLFKGSRWINCHHKNKCGESTDLFAEYQKDHGLEWKEALRALAQETSVSLPEYSHEQSEAYRAKQAKSKLYKDISTFATFVLWRAGNEEVTYLRNRGYSDSDLHKMDVGKTPEREALKEKLLEKGHDETLINDFLGTNFRPESAHTIMIPYRDRYGNYLGFVYRNTDTKDKYRYSSGLLKGELLFDLDKAHTGDAMIVVEGIFDAKTINARLLESKITGYTAVAIGTNQPSLEQLNLIREYRNIFICLDNDPAGYDGVNKIIGQLRKYENNIQIVELQTVKDPDLYIMKNGIEDFIKHIKASQSSIEYECTQILNKYSLDGVASKENALNELLDLEALQHKAIYSQEILRVIDENIGLDSELLIDKINTRHSERDRKANISKLENSNQHIKELLRAGKLEDARTAMQVAGKESILTGQMTNIKPYSIVDLRADLSQRKQGKKTSFLELDNKTTIPTGAITLVAGRPSHGKTVFMLNLLLNMVKQYNDETFVFYSYEESIADISTKIIMNLSELVIEGDGTHNFQCYLDYISSENNRINGINQAMRVFEDLQLSNRLILVPTNMPVQELTAHIEHCKNTYNLGGCFVDYAQKIPSNSKYGNIREKVLEVSDELKEVAKSTGIPTIVGAQLNRNSEGTKPSLENLKEAGNLEEDANLVLGVHNYRRAEKDLKDKLDGTDDSTVQSKYKTKLETFKKFDTAPNKTDLEIMIMKNRNGITNEKATLSFNGSIWKITDKRS